MIVGGLQKLYLQGRITLYLAKINQKNNGEHSL